MGYQRITLVSGLNEPNEWLTPVEERSEGNIFCYEEECMREGGGRSQLKGAFCRGLEEIFLWGASGA